MAKYFARLFMYPPRNKTYDEEIGLLSYKHTAIYDDEDQASTNGIGLLEEAYSDITCGKIKFPWIDNPQEDNVRLRQVDQRIIYEDHGVTVAVLCGMVTVEVEIDGDNIYFRPTPCAINFDDDFVSFSSPVPDFSICRYGLFNYAVCGSRPVIAKRFWYFTKIDKIVEWFFTKYTYNVLEPLC